MFALSVYVPATHANAVREALAISNAGAVRNYDSCSFSSTGTGRFRPLEGAKPAIGSIGIIEEVTEEKIETVVLQEHLHNVLRVVKAAHPYEEPAIHLVSMLDYNTVLSSIEPVGLAQQSNRTGGENKFGISIVLEGLDGVGKSTISKKLAERLDAKLMSTPPPIMQSARSWFVEQGDPALRKAYYMVGNFIAGAEMEKEVHKGVNVVLDRYYASTMAYILGKQQKLQAFGTDAVSNGSTTNVCDNSSSSDSMQTESANSSSVMSTAAAHENCEDEVDTSSIEWPDELYKPTYMFVLVLPEEDRIQRRSTRTAVAETAEEKFLRENPLVPLRINRLYERLGCTKIELLASDSVDAVVEKILGCIFSQDCMKKEQYLSK